MRPVIQRWSAAGDIATVIYEPEADSGSGDWQSFKEAAARSHLLVLSASADRREDELRKHAKAAGVATVQIIDTWYNYRGRFAAIGEDPSMVDWPDAVLVIDEGARREAAAEGIPASKLVIAGQPAWEQAIPLPEGDMGHVLFVDQPIRDRVGSGLGYDEYSAFAILEHGIRTSAGRWRAAMVCLHPERRGVSPFPVEPIPSAEGLARAEVVVGMFSSLMLDAFLGGKRVLSLQPGLRSGNRDPLSRWGLIPLTIDIENLPKAMEIRPDVAAREALRTCLAGSASRADNALRQIARQHCG